MRHRRDSSAGIIVFRREDGGCRFLLILSRLTKRPLWEFPKGGVDAGETTMDAALRELEEETGLGRGDVRLVSGFERTERYRFMVGRGDERELVHKRVTYYLAEALTTRMTLSAAEVMESAWVDLEEARRRVRYPERRRLLEAAASAIGCADG